jgi:hypothetical protein
VLFKKRVKTYANLFVLFLNACAFEYVYVIPLILVEKARFVCPDLWYPVPAAAVV